MADSQERIAASRLLENNVKRIVDENRREARGYRSLAQLAEAIEISAPSLTHALKHNPSLSTIQKIADSLNVSVASLFYDERQIEGYISVGGCVTRFHTEEELQNALAKRQFTFGI
ncbi:MAG: helix-turn-helix transcriptional regulator [Paludibacteraceae bacterium]|nr:helix-turn-helix transcriptional regulator [Paludibacteraceae bacterium]